MGAKVMLHNAEHKVQNGDHQATKQLEIIYFLNLFLKDDIFVYLKRFDSFHLD